MDSSRITWYFEHQVEKAHQVWRGAVAALLLALFLFPSLQLASPKTSCCQGKMKCCCKNSHSPSPALSERSCGTECASITLGGIAAATLPARDGAVPGVVGARLIGLPSTGFPAAVASDPLHQRPPPSRS